MLYKFDDIPLWYMYNYKVYTATCLFELIAATISGKGF